MTIPKFHPLFIVRNYFTDNMRTLFVLLACVVTLASGTEFRYDNAYLKVKTSGGYVRGYLGKSCRSGKFFAGFRGIPYAEPPLGELRFRDPVPKRGWNGVWDSTYQRPGCIQELEQYGVKLNRTDFDEDCLYLNVYSPNLNVLKYGIGPLKAVMVFIHPGAFTTGSTSEKSIKPDFLIDKDVVVVTFNYRLGALGFLTLQNEDVPGNAGLKDQNLVLKWVKYNIKRFGGDPNMITIFGESAGSASVNYHILSKASAGLFRSAIMESGVAIAPWAYSPPDLALKKAVKFAGKVKCTQTQLPALLKCLQRVPVNLIREHQQEALTVEELLTLRIVAFHPTTEPDLPGAFLTSHPFDMMYAGNFTKVPVIIGSNADEGLLVYPTLMSSDPNGYLITLLGMDLSRFAPYNFHVKPFTKTALKIHQLISKFYFDGKFLTKALMNNVLELLADVMFILPDQLTASLFANVSVPVYNYYFTYDGGYNAGKLISNISDVPGVCHGDDLGYLFYSPEIHRECGRNVPAASPDEIMIDRMTRMWTNFAKTGNPTPRRETEIGCKWMPFTSTERNYLDIGRYLVPSNGLKLSNMLFWEELIKNLIELDGNHPEAIDKLDLS